MRIFSRLLLVAFAFSAIAAAAQGPGPGQHQAALTCTPGTGNAKFNFYRGNASGGPYSKLNSTPANACSFNDTSVAGNTTYFYVATGIDASSNESVMSAELKVVIPSSPASPGGVLVDVGQTKAVLTWGAVAGSASYNVWRITGSGSAVLIGTVSAPTLTYTDSTIVAGNTYTWFVTSLTTGGTESVLSAAATVRPAPPTQLNVTIF
jgi:fibronectin type 3 domain-containing protein